MIKSFGDADTERQELRGDRAGRYSIRVNRQWRICFRWSDSNAHDVELIDYHD